MPTPVADSYSALSGTLLRAGILAPGLYGNVTLAALVAAGAIDSLGAKLLGNLAMADAAPGGAFSGLVRPSWLQSAAVNEWVAVPNSTLSGSPGEESPLNSGYGQQAARVNNWNGTALDTRSSRIWLGATGGHSDWAGNGVSSFGLGVDSPAWRLDRDRTIQGNGTSTGIPVGQTPDQIGRAHV